MRWFEELEAMTTEAPHPVVLPFTVDLAAAASIYPRRSSPAWGPADHLVTRDGRALLGAPAILGFEDVSDAAQVVGGFGRAAGRWS